MLAAGDESGEGASEIGCHSQSWGLGLLRHARCSRLRFVMARPRSREVGSLTLGSRVVLGCGVHCASSPSELQGYQRSHLRYSTNAGNGAPTRLQNVRDLPTEVVLRASEVTSKGTCIQNGSEKKSKSLNRTIAVTDDGLMWPPDTMPGGARDVPNVQS